MVTVIFRNHKAREERQKDRAIRRKKRNRDKERGKRDRGDFKRIASANV